MVIKSILQQLPENIERLARRRYEKYYIDDLRVVLIRTPNSVFRALYNEFVHGNEKNKKVFADQYMKHLFVINIQATKKKKIANHIANGE